MIASWILIGLSWFSGKLTAFQETYQTFLNRTEHAVSEMEDHVLQELHLKKKSSEKSLSSSDPESKTQLNSHSADEKMH